MLLRLSLLSLLGCGDPVDEPPAADSAEPAPPERPACLDGHASVQICVEGAERYGVYAWNQERGEDLQTLLEGPGCSPVYLEPGSWSVSLSVGQCSSSFEVVLSEVCENVLVERSSEDFVCGDRG
jgi:hypothetical protein